MSAGIVSQLKELRPYQREAFAAVLGSVMAGQGGSFSIEMARQGGKNELSARLELTLLYLNQDRDVTSIKAAPTFSPQVRISMDRLWARAWDAGLGGYVTRETGNCIRLGRARQLFLSADRASNVVGHTANLLLEIDEAQDVDIAKFDKEFGPMAAANAATTVFYGTAWDDAGLLERARQAHLHSERRDGRKRHFEYDWRVVAAAVPEYARYVQGEQERLGAEHPLFLTQYCLRALPGAGRLLGPTQLTLLSGAHPRLEGPVAGETYVAGLDVAGEAFDASRERRDATVLTIGRVVDQDSTHRQAQDKGDFGIEVVRHYAWTGAQHGAVQSAVIAALQEWRVRFVVVDATGVGEPLASALSRSVGASRVLPLKLTGESKSRLGYGLLTAANTGRLRLYAGRDAEGVECRRQLELCRAVYRPNQTLSFFVEAGDGHDDYVISLALMVHAAADAGPRRAKGRNTE